MEDGKDDLIIGAYGADNGAGQAYVLYGQAYFDSPLSLSSLNGTNGFIINGINSGDYVGNSVVSAGDINGDGKDDLIIGAPGNIDEGNYDYAGQAYVIYGGALEQSLTDF